MILQKNFRNPPVGMGGNRASSGQDDLLSRFFGGFGNQAEGGANPMRGFSGSGAGHGAGLQPSMASMDPLSAEYQKALEERIRQNNINENAQYAQEYNPELYSHITMLYIECSINGNEIQAFVDSGAQSTIMSSKCAEKCGLMRLLDTRFQGIAQGVGTSKILGRIHAAQIQIGNVFFTTSLTVLEDNKIDMLFGLDNLKRHRCCIDLGKNQLTLNNGEVAVPFLHENQIQKDFIEEAKEAEMNVDKEQHKPETEKIHELMLMGYEEAECIRALKQARGNLQLAASILANM